MVKRILQYFRRETVLSAALICALLSFLLTPPSVIHLQGIDTTTLLMLFSLMTIVAGFRRMGALDAVSRKLTRRVTTLRGLSAVMVALCFVLSMLVTNDVALLTLVPLTLLLFRAGGQKKHHLDSRAGDGRGEFGQHGHADWQSAESVPVHVRAADGAGFPDPARAVCRRRACAAAGTVPAAAEGARCGGYVRARAAGEEDAYAVWGIERTGAAGDCEGAARVGAGGGGVPWYPGAGQGGQSGRWITRCWRRSCASLSLWHR